MIQRLVVTSGGARRRGRRESGEGGLIVRLRGPDSAPWLREAGLRVSTLSEKVVATGTRVDSRLSVGARKRGGDGPGEEVSESDPRTDWAAEKPEFMCEALTVEEFLDEVDVGEDHAAAAVALEPESVERLAARSGRAGRGTRLA